MKKIMFDDRFMLTRSVINGCKIATRRIIKFPEGFDPKTVPTMDLKYESDGYVNIYCGKECVARSKYAIGEIVAVAQSYKDIMLSENISLAEFCKRVSDDYDLDKITNGPGLKNKMFVQPEFMQHYIRVKNIRVQFLHEMSQMECISEGLYRKKYENGEHHGWCIHNVNEVFETPRKAFATLIDFVSGKGTWDSNPLVWVYSFELIS